jgi:FkbM family methyltransferase
MKDGLIYDIGMHNGNDTAYYLHRGYSVVAVEANPLFVEAASGRFANEIAEGRLQILNKGIAAEKGKATFWVNDDCGEWSSFIQRLGCRNNTKCHPLEVDCVRLKDIMAENGVPYYMKIDIEGNDLYCLQDLDKGDLPRYVSVEAHSLEYLCLLHTVGYRGFKVVEQSGLCKTCMPDWNFSMGCSGPFGEDVPGEWEDLETVAYDWLHYKLDRAERSSLRKGWHDFHATLDKPVRGPYAKEALKYRRVKEYVWDSRALPAKVARRLLRVVQRFK